jgi:hypothetical protein
MSEAGAFLWSGSRLVIDSARRDIMVNFGLNYRLAEKETNVSEVRSSEGRDG